MRGALPCAAAPPGTTPHKDRHVVDFSHAEEVNVQDVVTYATCMHAWLPAYMPWKMHGGEPQSVYRLLVCTECSQVVVHRSAGIARDHALTTKVVF